MTEAYFVVGSVSARLVFRNITAMFVLCGTEVCAFKLLFHRMIVVLKNGNSER